MPAMPDATGFAELDGVLDRLVAGASAVLGSDLVGAYLVGSFALGDADEHSDVDVLVAVARPLTAVQEAGLRALHADLPAAEGHWNRELEGSYAPVEELRTLGGLGRRWLYVDRGATEMEWSTHCNTHEHRWTLRHCGVALAGPPPAEIVDELPEGVLRDAMRENIPGLMEALATWTDVDRIAWAQRYAVATACRMLYSVATDAVASKRGALVWARENLPSEWAPLLESALAGRARGWNPDDRPSPGDALTTQQFARYCARAAQDLWTRR
jgi:predicted nucleotidyltransferase